MARALIMICLIGLYGGHASRIVMAAPAVPLLSAASEGAIRFSFGQEHLVLGEVTQQEIAIHVPPGAQGLEVSVSPGQVGIPRKVASDRYLVTYQPPRQFFPQVAIFAASARGMKQDIVGWALLPLWGKGEAPVRSRPGSPVTVRVGEKEYGPVTADAQGIAVVPLVVPPGVTEVQARQQQIALSLPPMKQLHLWVVPAHFAGDQRQKIWIYAVTLDATGQPSQQVMPVVDAFGQSPAMRSVQAGLWRGAVEVPAGKPSQLEVSAALTGIADSSVTFLLQRKSGSPWKMSIQAPARIGVVPTTLRIQLNDLLGTPVEGTLSGHCSEGILEKFIRRGPGQYESLWRPPLLPRAPQAKIVINTSRGLSKEVVISMAHYQPPQQHGSRLRPWLLWTGIAATGALLTSGLVTRGIALSQSGEYKEKDTSIERRIELRDSGEALTLASTITLSLAGVTAVATGLLYLLKRPAEQPPRRREAAAPAFFQGRASAGSIP